MQLKLPRLKIIHLRKKHLFNLLHTHLPLPLQTQTSCYIIHKPLIMKDDYNINYTFVTSKNLAKSLTFFPPRNKCNLANLQHFLQIINDNTKEHHIFSTPPLNTVVRSSLWCSLRQYNDKVSTKECSAT